MKKEIFGAAAAMLVLGSLDGALGSLLLYEGFDYATGAPLHELNGGSNWGSPWRDTSLESENLDVISFAGLSHENLQTSGKSLHVVAPSASGSLDDREIRPFTYINATSGNNASNTLNTWISFLVRFDGTLSPTETASLGVSAGTQEGYAFGIYPDEDGIQRFGIGSTWSGNQTMISMEQAFAANSTYLLVARIQWDTASAASETVSLYVNPVLGATDPGTPLVVRNDINLATSLGTNRLGWLGLSAGGGDTQWYFDEIRLGQSYLDVTPTVPEPAAVAFLAGATAVLLARRRRTSLGRD